MARIPQDKSVPNLANATPGGLIDMLGDIRTEIKRLQFLEGVYKQAIEARVTPLQLKGENLIKGEKYVGHYTNETQERINADLVREKFKDDPDGLASVIKITPIRKLGVTMKQED